ncbi:hypothetical protein M3Y94_00763000 [Aphelenchoides besseyi]|nr:hypothetical protein M3Y94_00763000 [Aphelenchoides besseyi]KAI6232192.1 hypothetical protein M3Y95_00460700 [Aphelenchoides besseyi]
METKTARMGEGQLLSRLLQEAENDSSIDDNDHDRELSAERHLQSMLENYQSHVRKTKHSFHPKGVHMVNGGGHDMLKVNGGVEGSTRMRINAANGHSTPQPMSHSQPCLYVTEQKYEQNGNFPSSNHYPHSSDPRDFQENGVTSAIDIAALRTENSLLRQQVEMLQKNTSTLRKLEMSYEKIEKEFTTSLLLRDKEEKLEQSARNILEQHIQRLSNENGLLQQQVANLNLAVAQHPQMDPEHLHHYNMLMTDLVPQNKELMAIKERQQMEIEAQNATLEEQRNHIEILESALKNAQERLASKDRAAVDAVALVDKCAHQQKLVQETKEEKQKMQDEYERQKAQLEMEVAQLKVQLENSRTRNAGRSTDGDELLKLHKTLQSKDDRISQLETTVRDLQKRYNDEVQRNESTTRNETDSLLNKIRLLEKERGEKEQRIQDLLDEKQRIHGQWADERRSLDHRVRLLEQDLRHIMSTNTNGPSVNYSQAAPIYQSAESPSPLRQSMGNVPTSARAAVLHDSGALKMEELRQRIAERRTGAANSWLLSRQQRPIRPNSHSSSHARSASGSALADYSTVTTTPNYQTTINSTPPATAIVSLINPVGHHGSASSSADSTTSESAPNGSPPAVGSTSPSHPPISSTPSTSGIAASRMSSKMPGGHLASYIDNLPAATRRRFVNAAEQNHAAGKTTKRTAIALGTSGYRRAAWNSSENGGPTSVNRSFDKRSLADTHNPTVTSNASTASSADGEPTITINRNGSMENGSLTSVVEVNRDHLSTREEFKKRTQQSSLKNVAK